MKKRTDKKTLFISNAVKRLIESAGHLSQSLGLGRILGQIYALCYFSQDPLSLDDIQTLLGISKGSASMGIRQLKGWGALESVWIKGDRKDYYNAADSFRRIIKSIVIDTAGKRIASSTDVITEAEKYFEARSSDGTHLSREEAFVLSRIGNLRDFQKKIKKTWAGMISGILLK